MVLFFHIGMRLSMLVFFAGVALLFGGFSAFGVAMKTKGTPTPITAAELSASGPPKDNAFVHVTNYVLNSEYIVMKREKATASESYSGVWLQIIPAGKSAGRGGKPIILKDDNIHGDADLLDFAKHNAFDAIVSNGMNTVTDPPATPAGMHFPVINEKEDVILEMKARPDFVYAFFMSLLGVLCCVGGVLPMYLKGRQMRAANGGGSGITSRKL